jgi:hypothetical protein
VSTQKELTSEEIKTLAELYDSMAYAIDPFCPERDKAEKEFYQLLEKFHCTHAPKMEFHVFKRGAVSRCIKYLKKN